MRIKTTGTAITITSSITKEEFIFVTKHNPSAACMVDEKGNPIFAVAVGSTNSINERGVIFDSTDEDGFMQLTTNISAAVPAADRMNAVIDKVLVPCNRLSQWEGSFVNAAEQLDAARTDFLNNIEG